jgi:hypothetical protein
MIRRFYPWADAVTAVSDGVADDLRACRHRASQIVTTWNPVVSPALAEAPRSLDHPGSGPGAAGRARRRESSARRRTSRR